MNYKKLLAASLIGLSVSMSAYSQCKIKQTAKADAAYQANNFAIAVEQYSKALGKIKSKDKDNKNCVLYQIAKSYIKLNDLKKADATFKKLVKNKATEPKVYMDYGNMLKKQGRYEDAIAVFEEYKKLNPSDMNGELALKSCELAIAWQKNPTCYVLENQKQWNSKEMDFAPMIAKKKGDVVIFTSNRVKTTMGKEVDIVGVLNEDFYESINKKGKWSEPKAVPIISTNYSEGAGTFDSKYSTLYYSQCKQDKYYEKKQAGCQIYSVRKQGTGWAEPIKLAELAPDTFVTGHPTLAPKGEYMIFASNMPGGFGGMDLYIATYDKKKKTFVNPKNLGPAINGKANELYPHIRVDGTLYFSSDRAEGMGGLDIYKAEKTGDNQWSKVENMKYPMNSPMDDFGIIFTAGREEGYLSSNRSGGKGSDDIYKFTIPESTIFLSGTVRDKDTREIIAGAKVEMKDPDGKIIEATTDATGFYKLKIPFGTAYDMTASKKDYYNDVNRANTLGLDPLKTCKDTNIIADFLLKTTKVNLEFEIQFVFDQAYPEPEYMDTVKNLLTILQDNPTFVVEIGAHTDSRGSDKYNEALADRRAKWIVNYLIENGIDTKRLVPKGYGEYEPRTLLRNFTGLKSKRQFEKGLVMTETFINELKTKEGEDVFEDAHRLNRRVSLKKLSEDFKPVKPKDDDDTEDAK